MKFILVGISCRHQKLLQSNHVDPSTIKFQVFVGNLMGYIVRWHMVIDLERKSSWWRVVVAIQIQQVTHESQVSPVLNNLGDKIGILILFFQMQGSQYIYIYRSLGSPKQKTKCKAGLSTNKIFMLKTFQNHNLELGMSPIYELISTSSTQQYKSQNQIPSLQKSQT